MNATSYLENLARRIETAARTPNSKATLFAIADDLRRFKERQYDGSPIEELDSDTADTVDS